jgi:hypothetical protein
MIKQNSQCYSCTRSYVYLVLALVPVVGKLAVKKLYLCTAVPYGQSELSVE